MYGPCHIQIYAHALSTAQRYVNNHIVFWKWMSSHDRFVHLFLNPGSTETSTRPDISESWDDQHECIYTSYIYLYVYINLAMTRYNRKNNQKTLKGETLSLSGITSSLETSIRSSRKKFYWIYMSLHWCAVCLQGLHSSVSAALRWSLWQSALQWLQCCSLGVA